MMSLLNPREKLLALHGKVEAEEKSRCRTSKIIRLAERYLTAATKKPERERVKQADDKR